LNYSTIQLIKNYRLIKTLADPNGPLMTPFPRMCLAGWAKYLAPCCAGN